MKPIYKILAATLFVALCTTAFFAFRKTGQYKRAHNPQRQVFLYELNPSVAVNANNFPSLVQKIAGSNFKALKQEKTETGQRFTSSDPSEYYEVSEGQGRFSFSKSLSRYMGNYKPSLPDPKAAQQLAMNFLKENKLMAESQDEMQLIHSGGLRADDENGNVIDKMITLTYGRVIGGVPVIGSGSKIVVHIGEKGEVMGVIRNWKAYTTKRELGAKEVKTAAEMEREFQALVITQFGKEAKAEIKRSYMVYFDNGGKYLQPVMAYETTVNVMNAAGQSQQLPYLGIIEAMRNPAEKLNLTRVDPAGLRFINANKLSPDNKPKPLDKED